jgi:hypothetical protein
LIAGCVDQSNRTTSENSSTAISAIEYNAIFKRLISEIIDAMQKDDLSSRLDKIWKIYDQELFADIGFCGNKPLRTLLEINASFFLAPRGRYLVKKYEYENALDEYEEMKKNLLRDLKILQELNSKIDSDYRYKITALLERIYTLHLRNFVDNNRNFLTDVFYDFIRRTTKNRDRIPAGFIAVLPQTYFEQHTSLPNPELDGFVFSLKNSNCKIVMFIEGFCDAAVYKMYLFDPKNRKELEKIDIDVKSLYDDTNCKYIHIGHTELIWNKEDDVFTVDRGQPYERKYFLDTRRRTVRSIKK